MKKKKLTMNMLAFCNLKNHKKNYAVMIIGIILAMMFSSSIIISIFSISSTNREYSRNAFGAQDAILINVNEELMKETVKDGYVEEYGFAHMLGYASTNAENVENGFCFAWLDDTAKKLSYQSFIEGAYPTNENEIAVEQSVLIRLGIEAKIGEEINFDVFSLSGIDYEKNYNQKTYKLVGIVKDKALTLNYQTDNSFIKNIPAAFVSEGSDAVIGEKEILISYLTFADFKYPEWMQGLDTFTENDESREFSNYISGKYDTLNLVNEIENWDFKVVQTSYYSDSLITIVSYGGIIGAVLALTSCIAIINSFNSNIKERKQQIGMLRAVGTTKRQIIRMLCKEAMIISLVSIPVSLAISYLFMFALSSIFGEQFVLTIDVLSVVCCGIVGFITVMLAALIPIIFSSRITPMQAIRNIDVTRKMKTKKIKSQKNFSVPKLLAKRTMAFHKGNQIAVSILLISTILLSCFGFSSVSYEKHHPYDRGYDYSVFCGYYYDTNVFTNPLDQSGAISNADKQTIATAPYISNAFGVKRCNINILIDEYTDYFKILGRRSVFDEYSLEGYNGSNFDELVFSHFSKYYSKLKAQAGFEKDFLPTTLYAVDEWKVEEFEKYLVSGEINLDKLASGEEVILFASQKAAVFVDDSYDDSYDFAAYDNEINDRYTYDFYGECEYKAGDVIDLSMLMGDSDFERVDKKVKIGAVISSEGLQNDATDRYIIDYGQSRQFGVITSIAGMNNFSKIEKYQDVYMFVDDEMKEDIDDTVISYVNPILYKYQGGVSSNYEDNQYMAFRENSMLVAIIALIIIGFAICASLTNNAFTASIRERKRELGTLRAVGISRREFVESYVRQLLKTFAIGYSVGFGLFAVGYLIRIIKFYLEKQSVSPVARSMEFELEFNPWITMVFCIVLFAVCSIHLWIKIRNEMKNSIIDNIREL
ncbi:MAG: ABC transporter permease [Eubacterium sp.]|nr:ABC transporter permease [Eubacterium sp.]